MLSHVSESYTLLKCTSKPGYEGTFVWTEKGQAVLLN